MKNSPYRLGLFACFTALLLSSMTVLAETEQAWATRALKLQDAHSRELPMSEISVFGTHNSYNSTAYEDWDSYWDPQQYATIFGQLGLGARFIELDVWHRLRTNSPWPWDWSEELVLCHGGVCSGTDMKFSSALAEIRDFLNYPENQNEVIILYIEDHYDTANPEVASDLNTYLGNKIYRSEGCKAIPATLSKADVLRAGKNVVVWNDGGCSGDGNIANLAFTGLGAISRIWEDATSVNSFVNFFEGGEVDRIDAQDVSDAVANGVNIINLDNFTDADNRRQAAIWSWDVIQPDNWQGNQDCAVQRPNGRWDDTTCGSAYQFACMNQTNGTWAVTSQSGVYQSGEAMCSGLGSDFQFAYPRSYAENQALMAAKGATSYVWIALDDLEEEGNWDNSAPEPASIEIVLKGAHGNHFYSLWGGNSDVLSNTYGVGSWNRLLLHSDTAEARGEPACIRNGDQIDIRSQSGWYWYATPDGYLLGNTGGKSAWTEFTLLNLSDTTGCLEHNDTIAIRSVHNLYVVAESTGHANANRSAIGAWEMIQLQMTDQMVLLPDSLSNYAGSLVLNAGEMISNWDRKLIMQGDGNLVLYTKAGHPLWASGTSGTNHRAVFQGDGNLVIYNNNGPVWATGTMGGPDSRLELQFDGNLVIYDGAGSALWATGTTWP